MTNGTEQKELENRSLLYFRWSDEAAQRIMMDRESQQHKYHGFDGEDSSETRGTCHINRPNF